MGAHIWPVLGRGPHLPCLFYKLLVLAVDACAVPQCATALLTGSPCCVAHVLPSTRRPAHRQAHPARTHRSAAPLTPQPAIQGLTTREEQLLTAATLQADMDARNSSIRVRKRVAWACAVAVASAI